MRKSKENKTEAIQYLFSELGDESRDEFEERLFTDEDFNLFVNDVENDLIDEYIRGELEFKEKRRFESKYLISESRREKVGLARTLHIEVFNKENQTIASVAKEQTFWQSVADFFRVPSFALASGIVAVILMVLLGGVFLMTQQDNGREIVGGDNSNISINPTPILDNPTPKITTTPEETPSENNQSNPDELPKSNKIDSDTKTKTKTKTIPTPQKPDSNKPEKKPTPTPVKKQPEATPQQPKIFAFSLLPPLRSSKNPVIKIPSSAETVRLKLFDNFGQKYEKFTIKLNDGGGNAIWSREIKASKTRPQKSITISVPNTQFKSGNYEIAVSGITKDGSVEEINFYDFVVKRD